MNTHLPQIRIELFARFRIEYTSNAPGQGKEHGSLYMTHNILFVILGIFLNGLVQHHFNQIKGSQQAIEFARLDELSAITADKGLTLEKRISEQEGLIKVIPPEEQNNWLLTGTSNHWSMVRIYLTFSASAQRGSAFFSQVFANERQPKVAGSM